MDVGDTSTITFAEFEAHFRDEEARAFFESLEIEMGMVFDVFNLLDTDGGGTIDINEFVDGCLKLRGNARALDIARLECLTKRLEKKMLQTMQTIKRQNVPDKASLVSFDHRCGLAPL